MAVKTSRITEQLRDKLFANLDRYRVSGMDQGAQLCVLCDAADRFLQSSGESLEMTETNQLVREYLEKKQAKVIQQINWNTLWNLRPKRTAGIDSFEKSIPANETQKRK